MIRGKREVMACPNFSIRMVFRGLVNVRPLVKWYLGIDIGT